MVALFSLLSCLVLVKQGQPQTLEVFAAASLHESFQAIGRSFELKHPGVAVHLNFAGSQQLAAQINQGAPCDLFASADERNLEKIAYDPSSRRVFALNHLVLVTPRDGTIGSFRGLDSVRSIILAAPAVPVGGYSRACLQRAAGSYGTPWFKAVESHVVSEEQDVREVLAKVELGEADAGMVYATDAASASGRVRTIAVPAEFQPSIAYPVAIAKGAKQARLARQFVRSLLEAGGQEELVSRGFVSPLGPRSGVWLSVGSKRRLIPTHLPTSGQVTVTATGPDNKPHGYSGTPIARFLKGARGKTIELVGADEYRVTLPLTQVLKANAVLRSSSPGNLQLVVPGSPPHTWVDWLVEINVKE
jgi:molybdate transport system substrate-binding protein